MNSFEIEQKYTIKNPARIRQVLKRFKARKLHRGHEINDLLDFKGELRKHKKVLRLRRNGNGSGLMTFKGPRMKSGRFKKRLEVETPVDFEKAQKIFELLGFNVARHYEKYREEYALGTAHVTLDRLKGFGWFVEIEASPAQIHSIAKRLGLSEKDQEDRTYLEILAKKREKAWLKF